MGVSYFVPQVAAPMQNREADRVNYSAQTIVTHFLLFIRSDNRYHLVDWTTAMPAEILHCPACGASVSSDATRCEYCGSRLATVACPSCFGMMFVGAKFCSHCGASASRTEVSDNTGRPCPRCHVDMKMVMVGGSSLLECPQCEGLWADAANLQQICTEREKQAAVLGMPAPPVEAVSPEQNIQYVPCPVCHKLMNRVNFAHCSNVIVDVCKAHGTWFDKDELRRTVEFIRAGGLEKARARQLADIEDERRRLASALNTGIPFDTGSLASSSRDVQTGIFTAVDLLRFLLE
jgi:Zn-finger nucleic acid-binding protein